MTPVVVTRASSVVLDFLIRLFVSIAITFSTVCAGLRALSLFAHTFNFLSGVLGYKPYDAPA